MIRHLCLEFSTVLYHVVPCGNARKQIYLEERDVELFTDQFVLFALTTIGLFIHIVS